MIPKYTIINLFMHFLFCFQISIFPPFSNKSRKSKPKTERVKFRIFVLFLFAYPFSKFLVYSLYVYLIFPLNFPINLNIFVL